MSRKATIKLIAGVILCFAAIDIFGNVAADNDVSIVSEIIAAGCITALLI